MRIRILGPLEVLTEDQWQPIGSPKWRSLLACLLLRSGQIVSTDSLMDELWADGPPDTAKNLISIYVLRLRRLLGDADGKLLAYRSPGYVLNLADGDLDAHRFGALIADGRSALMSGDATRAATLLAAGLSLCRGPFLADVPPSPLISVEAEHAMELRLSATELWAEADLACGRPAEVIPELRRLVGENQLRERLWLLLMRALDAAGRHAEALEAYGQAREAIAEELGVDPGTELQSLYADLLAADAATPKTPPAAQASPSAVESAPPAADAEPSPAGDIPFGEIPGRIMVGNYDEAEPPRPATPQPPQAAGPTLGAPLREALADLEILRPTQLPADIGDFTGRETQVSYLCDMLTQRGAAGGPGAVPLAFVAGAGGLGKTTLAIHAAHQIRDQFPDGQLYVDLLGATPQPLAPGEVLARFLRDLGVEGSKVPVGDEERAALYRTRLTGRRVLVVLDNARDSAQVRPLLPGSASCAVLVTTRNRTADLASTRYVDLHVLDDDEALALFARVLGDDRALAEPDATAEVLIACAGLPLAIRICAARLAARHQWRIATMANRLRDQRRRLDELKVGDLAVRASFQVSYESLQRRKDNDPARTFRLLGLWQGPSISLSAAAALVGVADFDSDGVATALEGLVDAHLLESPDPDWYRFHDLLRFYATECAQADEAEEERAAAIDRLLHWYLRTADGAAQVVSPHGYRILLGEVQGEFMNRFEATEDALTWYDSERANIAAATRQAAAAGIHEVAWRLPAVLFPVFNRRDNWADCVALHRVALKSVRATGNRQGEAWVRHNLGLALARLRDREGIGYLEEALAIRRDISDSAGEVQAALNIADAYYHIEGPQVALKYMQQSAEVVRETGRPARYAAALNNLGEVYLELDRLDEAARCFEQVVDIVMGIDESYIEGHGMHNLGRVHLAAGRLDRAVATLRDAVTIHQATGDQMGEAVALTFLGRAQRDLTLVDQARRSWTVALRILAALGKKEQVAAIEAEMSSLPPAAGSG
jgi:DNA-binding SARP family transcriptional activator